MDTMIMTAVSLLVAVALYAWFGVTLGKVFGALGAAPWKAWVPLVSQVETLHLAKRPGWHVVLLAVPVYGLVVYYQVLRDLTRLFGRPQALALIGVILLPIWAGAVAGGRAAAVVTTDRPAAGPPSLGVESIFGLSSSARPETGPGTPPPAPVARPSGGVAPPPPPVPAGLAAGYGPSAAPYPSPASPAVATYPEYVAPAAPVVSAAPVVAAQPVPAAPAAPAAPAVGAFVPVPPAALVAQAVAPAQPVAPSAPPALPVAPPTVVGQPVPSAGDQGPALVLAPLVQSSPWTAPASAAEPSYASPPSTVPPAAVPPQPAVVPQPVVPQPVVPPVASMPSAVVPRPVPVAESSADVSDHTVVIDRRSSRPWSLVLDDGRSFDMWASSVVVGREPTATDLGVQMLAIPDDTRTISKRHARFDLVDGVWQVTELGSTNGVVVTGTDGRAFSVRSGKTSVVGSQLVLGSVVMRLVSRQSMARSA